MIAPLLLSLLGQVSAPPPDRLLVLDLEAVGVERDVARSVDPIVLAAASVDGVEVIAAAEIRKLADLEAAQAQVDCDTSTCLADLAGALGAEYVLFGSVSRLGTTTTVTLSLFARETAQVKRETVTTGDIGTLPTLLPPKVRGLVDDVRRGSPAHAEAKAKEARQKEQGAADGGSALGVVGVVVGVVGAVGVVGGGALAALNETTIQDPTAAGPAKQEAQQLGLIGLGVAGAGVVVGGAGLALALLGGSE